MALDFIKDAINKIIDEVKKTAQGRATESNGDFHVSEYHRDDLVEILLNNPAEIMGENGGEFIDKIIDGYWSADPRRIYNDILFYYNPSDYGVIAGGEGQAGGQNAPLNMTTEERQKDTLARAISLNKDIAPFFASRPVSIRSAAHPGVKQNTVRITVGPAYNGPAEASLCVFSVSNDEKSNRLKPFYNDMFLTVGGNQLSTFRPETGTGVELTETSTLYIAYIKKNDAGRYELVEKPRADITVNKSEARPGLFKRVLTCKDNNNKEKTVATLTFRDELVQISSDVAIVEDGELNMEALISNTFSKKDVYPGYYIAGMAVGGINELVRCGLDGGTTSALTTGDDPIKRLCIVKKDGTISSCGGEVPFSGAMKFEYRGTPLFNFFRIDDFKCSPPFKALVLKADLTGEKYIPRSQKDEQNWTGVRSVGDAVLADSGLDSFIFKRPQSPLIVHDGYWTIVNSRHRVGGNIVVIISDGVVYVWKKEKK